MRDIALTPNLAQPPRGTWITRRQGSRRRILARLLGRRLRAIDAQLCAPGALPMSGIHKIVVWRPNHRLGNTVLISPLLRELEALYPGAEIDIVSAGGAARALFGTRFQVRHVVGLPRRIPRHVLRTLQLLRSVRRERYDLAIDACLQSNMGRLLLGTCHARYKIGFPVTAESGSPMDAYHRECPKHFALRNVHLLRIACARPGERDWPMLHVGLSSLEIIRGERVLEAILGNRNPNSIRCPVLGIFANATGNKCYPEGWWVQFIDTFRERQPGVRIVDILAEHGHSQLPGETRPFYSRDLRKLAAVLANLDGFISADCGVMHLACAVGTPTLGLFARGNSATYAPYGGMNCAVDTHTGMDGDAAAIRAAAWVDRLRKVPRECVARECIA